MASDDELLTVLSPLLLDEERAIWITQNSYVCLHDEDDDSTVNDRHEKQFTLYLAERDKRYKLSIHATTLEESIICLDYLVGLNDTHFREMMLTYKDFGEHIRLCPFGANILEKMLLHSARQISFICMIFTADHCRTLAASGTKTNIGFIQCEFEDDGAAFVEASAARQDETSGPARLSIVGSNPFNDRNFDWFLSQHKLESLYLYMIDLNSEVSCRAVAMREVRCLRLERCSLDDGGAALAESVRQGCGPKELCFRGNPFGSSESFFTFMNALRGNEHLERLFITSIDDHQEKRALAAALHENKGLVHLEVDFRSWDESYWTEFLKAISLHPLLRSLNLTTMWQSIHSDFHLKKRRGLTNAVADMLAVNDRVEAMSFHDDTFDKDNWDAFVVPRLECNKYRKRFLSIQKIGEASTHRAAVLARTLATFSSKPHLVWMLLNQNHEIISSYLDSSHDLNSIPSRKRSRSPSLDGLSAH
jgi:hypothetical protein